MGADLDVVVHDAEDVSSATMTTVFLGVRSADPQALTVAWVMTLEAAMVGLVVHGVARAQLRQITCPSDA